MSQRNAPPVPPPSNPANVPASTTDAASPGASPEAGAAASHGKRPSFQRPNTPTAPFSPSNPLHQALMSGAIAQQPQLAPAPTVPRPAPTQIGVGAPPAAAAISDAWRRPGGPAAQAGPVSHAAQAAQGVQAAQAVPSPAPSPSVTPSGAYVTTAAGPKPAQQGGGFAVVPSGGSGFATPLPRSNAWSPEDPVRGRNPAMAPPPPVGGAMSFSAAPASSFGVHAHAPQELRAAHAHVVRGRAYAFVIDAQGNPIEIGSGRFGKVYLGEERWLDSKTDFRRQVVIKILQKGVSDDDLMRFQLEKELLERVQGHPSIVELFASGEGEDPEFIPAS
ncbi:MAG TPA: protein kinase, partial [Polyangiaceae bacterium]|nr:protein kinase [Polyangiaceae bacterium]